MRKSEKGCWFSVICCWSAFIYIGYFAIGGLIFAMNIDQHRYVPKKPSFTLEQLQQAPCLGCQLFEFQQTSKNVQYCCRIKGIDVLEHPSQCKKKSHCFDKGTNDINTKTHTIQFNQERENKIGIFWFIFWKLNIIELILIGLFIIRNLYLCLFVRPRPIEKIGNYLYDIFKRHKTSKNAKTKVHSLNEQIEGKTQSENELQVAGQVKE